MQLGQQASGRDNWLQGGLQLGWLASGRGARQQLGQLVSVQAVGWATRQQGWFGWPQACSEGGWLQAARWAGRHEDRLLGRQATRSTGFRRSPQAGGQAREEEPALEGTSKGAAARWGRWLQAGVLPRSGMAGFRQAGSLGGCRPGRLARGQKGRLAPCGRWQGAGKGQASKGERRCAVRAPPRPAPPSSGMHAQPPCRPALGPATMLGQGHAPQASAGCTGAGPDPQAGRPQATRWRRRPLPPPPAPNTGSSQR